MQKDSHLTFQKEPKAKRYSLTPSEDLKAAKVLEEKGKENDGLHPETVR